MQYEKGMYVYYNEPGQEVVFGIVTDIFISDTEPEQNTVTVKWEDVSTEVVHPSLEFRFVCIANK